MADPVVEAQYMARGRSVIAVAGTMMRAGSTTCSIALARSLVMMGQKPAIVVSQKMFDAFARHYKRAIGPDGASYVVNGVAVYQGVGPSAVPRSFTHVILDLGYLYWGLPVEDARMQQEIIEFGKADLQIVYITCCSPDEITWLERFTSSQRPADVNRYTMAVWGATQGIFQKLETLMHQSCPDAFMWQMPPVAWPFSLSEIPAGIVDALAPVLPRNVQKRFS